MDIVIESFENFVRDRFTRYRIGQQFYPDGALPGDQHSQNPYIKTEADVQVKFGGYLEGWLMERYPDWTVHAELPVYESSSKRADLTIHRIDPDKHWTTRKQIQDSLICVIEIKFANVRYPLYDFNNDGVNKDICLLRSLPHGVARYLVLVDEGELLEPDQIGNVINSARDNYITVISNNRKLMVRKKQI